MMSELEEPSWTVQPGAPPAFFVSKTILASTLGGILVVLTTNPMDVVKAHLQAQQTKKYSGSLDAAAKLARAEGILSLWRGLMPSLVMTLPAIGIYFTIFNFLKLQWTQTGTTLPTAAMLSGIMARTISVSVTAPFETLRTYVQANQLGHGYRALIGSFVQRQGLRGLWVGVGPTLARDVPFSALYWCLHTDRRSSYELLLARAQQYTGRTDSTFLLPFGSGFIAGSGAALVTLPFDVVKTRQQSVLNPSSFRTVTEQVWQEYGWRGFYQGAGPRLAKVAPACGIMISSYSYLMARLQ